MRHTISAGSFSVSSSEGALTLSALPFFLVNATSRIQAGITTRATTIAMKATLAAKRSNRNIGLHFCE